MTEEQLEIIRKELKIKCDEFFEAGKKAERTRLREAVEKIKKDYTKHSFIEAEYLEVFDRVLALLNS